MTTVSEMRSWETPDGQAWTSAAAEMTGEMTDEMTGNGVRSETHRPAPRENGATSDDEAGMMSCFRGRNNAPGRILRALSDAFGSARRAGRNEAGSVAAENRRR